MCTYMYMYVYLLFFDLTIGVISGKKIESELTNDDIITYG